jgi:hypothetical protein
MRQFPCGLRTLTGSKIMQHTIRHVSKIGVHMSAHVMFAVVGVLLVKYGQKHCKII